MITTIRKKKITKLRIKNHTDIDSDLLREIVRFVQPSGVSGFDVRVSNWGGTTPWMGRGMAYTHGSSLHNRGGWFVVVSLGKRAFFPLPPKPPARHKSGYLPIPWMGSREEAAVFIIAHELRHLWQRKIKSGYRVWGARGQYSERDCDAYAIRMLRQWRKAH